ncbi:hypothetical protein GCM10027417_29420 [Glutamicibacter endophyticus]|uniref:hypothetical protein n=1 Tax=Glutamicibacter sp. PS TaxID=3075634 RepID=UPI002850E24D|nr:hypothetical protein [Glutamicibacter sp. PS]MDR4534784.1 hypothetical protein [Glutamicibacter sp. PS]
MLIPGLESLVGFLGTFGVWLQFVLLVIALVMVFNLRRQPLGIKLALVLLVLGVPLLGSIASILVCRITLRGRSIAEH